MRGPFYYYNHSRLGGNSKRCFIAQIIEVSLFRKQCRSVISEETGVTALPGDPSCESCVDLLPADPTQEQGDPLGVEGGPQLQSRRTLGLMVKNEQGDNNKF